MRAILIVVFSLFAMTAFAEGTKIAVVDVQKALLLSDSAKKEFETFKKDNKTEVDKLKSLEQKIMKLKEKMQKNADVMSDSERNKLKSSYEEQVTEYKFYAQKLQQQEQKMQQSVFKSLLPKAQKLLKKIIDDGKYDLVLQANAGLVFAKPSVNITKQLLDSLNKN